MSRPVRETIDDYLMERLGYIDQGPEGERTIEAITRNVQDSPGGELCMALTRGAAHPDLMAEDAVSLNPLPADDSGAFAGVTVRVGQAEAEQMEGAILDGASLHVPVHHGS